MKIKKLNKTIIFILIFLISIGFAYLSTNLNINGISNVKGNTWDIHFEDIEVIHAIEGNTTPTISADKKTVNYQAKLDVPGDYFEFRVDAVNAGTLDAMVETVNNVGLTEEQAKILDVEIKLLNGDPLEPGLILMNGTRKTYSVRVEYKYDIEEEDLVTENINTDFNFSVSYQQATEDSYTTATFKTGMEVSEKMVQLSGATISYIGPGSYDGSTQKISPTFLGYTNNVAYGDGKSFVQKFLRANELKDGLTDDNIVSTNDSDKPIYIWFEAIDEMDSYTGEHNLGYIYWYSEADVIYFNEDSSNFFYYCNSEIRGASFPYLTDVSGINDINTNKVENMAYMFSNCSSLAEIDLSNFNTNKVTNMAGMFYYCRSITSLDLSTFNTSKVKNMAGMFSGMYSLESLDVTGFNTSKVEDMSSMFDHCELLEELNLTNFNTSNVTNMSSMFYDLKGLTSLDVSGFDTSKVTNMYDMFGACNNLLSLDLSNFNTSRVTTMRDMFNNCRGLTFLDLSSFDTSKVTTMRDMFFYCTGLEEVNLSSFNTTNVTTMEEMFQGCENLLSLNLKSFNTKNLTEMSYMFSGCAKITELDLTTWDTKKVAFMTAAFEEMPMLTTIKVSKKFITTNIWPNYIVFRNVPSLVGGNGTVYKSSYEGPKYAKPDGWSYDTTTSKWVNDGSIGMFTLVQ